MPTKLFRGTAVACGVFGVLLFSSRSQGPAEIDGHVYRECKDGRLVGPVQGAIVSTSLDRATATTAVDGRFTLVTDRSASHDEFYVVTVRTKTAKVSQRFMGSRLSSLEVTLSPPWPGGWMCGDPWPPRSRE